MSRMNFTELNNVKSTLSILALILTTLDNVELMLLFSRPSFIMLINVKYSNCEYDHFQGDEKSQKCF